MATRNKRAKITDNIAPKLNDCSLTFDYLDGGDTVTYRVADLPQNIRNICVVSRLHNKLMDSYADADLDPRHTAEGVWEMLKRGEWSERGEAAPQQSLLIDAVLAEMTAQGKDKTREDCVKFVESLEKEQRAALRKDPKIAAHIGRIEAERKAERAAKLAEAAKSATVSTTNLLANF